MGPEMMADFRRQAERFGAEFVTDDVTRVDFSAEPHRVWVGDEEYQAKAVIVATGATARQLGLESERQLQGKGVTYCATCDGAFYRDLEVIVVGGGDSAMEEAIFLTKFASKVTVIHRRSEFRASQIMLDRAAANEKIEFVTPAVVEEVLSGGDGKMRAVVIRDLDGGDDARDRGQRPVRRDRARPDDGALPRPARPRRGGLPRDEAGLDGDERPGRLRGGRRPGPHVPSGDHGGGLRLYGRARRRAVARGARGPSRDDAAPRGRRGLAEALVTVAAMAAGDRWIDLLDPTPQELTLEAPAGGPRSRARTAARPGRAPGRPAPEARVTRRLRVRGLPDPGDRSRGRPRLLPGGRRRVDARGPRHGAQVAGRRPIRRGIRRRHRTHAATATTPA